MTPIDAGHERDRDHPAGELGQQQHVDCDVPSGILTPCRGCRGAGTARSTPRQRREDDQHARRRRACASTRGRGAPIRRRFALRTALSAGRSTFSPGVNALRGLRASRERYSLGLAPRPGRPRAELLAGGALELLAQQRVGLLAVGAPGDPARAGRSRRRSGRADVVGLRDRAGRAVRRGSLPAGSVGSGSSERREREAEVDVVGEDARRRPRCCRRSPTNAYFARHRASSRASPQVGRLGGAVRAPGRRRTRAAPPCRGSRRG